MNVQYVYYSCFGNGGCTKYVNNIQSNLVLAMKGAALQMSIILIEKYDISITLDGKYLKTKERPI